MHLLFAIKFYNQLLVNRAIYIFTGRQRRDRRRHLAAGSRNPSGTPTSRGRLPRTFDVHVLAASLPDRKDVAGLYLVRRNVDLALIHQHVPVIYQLSRLAPRSREARAIHGIIEPPLKQEQKVFTRDSFLSRRALEIISKLSFENKVDALDLLLFAQLLAIPGQRLAAPHRVTMLSRRLCTALFDGTRRLVTAISLEKKFCTFAAAQAAHRISIPSQSFLPPV